MNTRPQFHGSDLEKVEKYYHIPKENITCFGGNVNPLGLSENVKKKICNNLDIISSYPDREYTSLRNAISSYCNVPANHILVGNGSTELISLLIEQRFPKKTLILGPTYSEYGRELSFSNSTVSYYYLKSEKNFNLNISDFLSVLEEGFDLLILCNPNNPTSSAIHTRDMKKILEFCKKHGTFVMIDETYVEFTSDINAISSVTLTSDFDNLIVLRGVSKFFAAPGLRLGYGITSNHALLDRVKERQIPWSLNSIAAFAGEQLFKDNDYIAKTKALILSERARILETLRTFHQIDVYEPYGNFFLIKIKKEGVKAFDLFEICIKQGLMIRDCSTFSHLDGEFIRFCIMMPEDNTKLLVILKNILG